MSVEMMEAEDKIDRCKGAMLRLRQRGNPEGVYERVVHLSARKGTRLCTLRHDLLLLSLAGCAGHVRIVLRELCIVSDSKPVFTLT